MNRVLRGDHPAGRSLCDVSEDLMHRFGEIWGIAAVTEVVLRLNRTHQGSPEELCRMAEHLLSRRPTPRPRVVDV